MIRNINDEYLSLYFPYVPPPIDTGSSQMYTFGERRTAGRFSNTHIPIITHVEKFAIFYIKSQRKNEHPGNSETSNRMALDKLQKQMDGGGCKIGGYARFGQDDPRAYGEVIGEELTDYGTLLFELDGDTFIFPAGGADSLDIDLNGGGLNRIR